MQTVADLVLARAGDDHLGLLFEDQRWTWSELVDAARRRAAWLVESRRDGPFHVGVLLDNVPEFVVLYLAAGLSGATVVGLNPTRRGDALAGDVRHTDCQMVLTDRDHAELLAGLDLGSAASHVVEVDDPDYEATLPPASAWPDDASAERRPEDLFLLLFTSGSSGAPKAVRMTQGRAVRASESLICSPGDVPYTAMPLFHGNVLNACVLPALRQGATLALRRRFSASEFLPDVRRFGCTYFSAIGRVLTYVLATPEQPDDADNPLKFVLGPESSAPDMAEFRRRFGCPVFAGYGSSENAVILMPAPSGAEGALGVATGEDDVAVVDPETGEECPRARFDAAGKLLNASEAIGELVGRDALDRFEGYYRNPEAEAERRRNGWYWSGDLAYRDADGVFWFAGRTSDWIRVDGENFATAPIERILGRFAPVRTAAVYGVPDERNAEDQVMAALELVTGEAFDPVAFAEFLAAQPDLGTKWAPRYVRAVADLPVTGTNKVDKKPLRAEGWTTADPVWWRPDRRSDRFVPLTPSDAESLSAALAANRPGIA